MLCVGTSMDVFCGVFRTLLDALCGYQYGCVLWCVQEGSRLLCVGMLCGVYKKIASCFVWGILCCVYRKVAIASLF